jgi:glycosyltransferase involved in cell wall biosynthesis
MRVTHVITRLVVGGAQENTIATVLGLQQDPAMEVDLISGPSPGPEGSLESSFRRRSPKLTVLPDLVRQVSPWQDWRAYGALKELFRKSSPAIVHTHSGKAGVLGRLAAASVGVPIIIHTIHGPSFGSFQGALANFVFTNAEKRAARATTHFVTVADAMTRQYLSAGIGRPEQYTRIFSGFSLAPFRAAKNDLVLRQSLGISAEDIVVSKIARLFPLKGHEELIAAAPKIIALEPRVKFLFLGDGLLREDLQQKINSRGLEKFFVFTGLVAPSDVPKYLGITDILVHLSRREGLARALPQALAAARPVVALDCDGAAEVCLDGQTGYLVPPGNSRRLIESIVELAAKPAIRERFGAAGRALAVANFSEEMMVEKLRALYLDLAKKNGVT